MAQTIYASFTDAVQAEKAAAALLDNGARNEDISIVANETHRERTMTNYNRDAAIGTTGTTFAQTPDREFGDTMGRNMSGATADTDTAFGTSTVPYDNTGTTGGSDTSYRAGENDNDMRSAADAAGSGLSAAGNKIAETGDRVAGGVADAVGADQAAANYRAAADQRNANADMHGADANREWADATDQDRTDYSRPSGATLDRPDIAVDQTNVGTPAVYEPERTEYADVAADARDAEDIAKTGITTTTAEDAGVGAIKGTGIGLGLGILAGLATLFVPGVGLVVGSGALAAALGVAAATTGAGAATGAVLGYLQDQGVPENVATTYDENIRQGGALLTVSLPSGDLDRDSAMSLLAKYDALNVNAYDNPRPI